MRKLWLPAAFLLFFCLSCTHAIPTPDKPVVLPGLDAGAPQGPTPSPGADGTESPDGGDRPTPTPHDNYRRPWDQAGGIPEDVPQLAYGVSEISYLNQNSMILRWSIINGAGIDNICAIVEDWVGRPMQYSEGADDQGRPTRIWKNDNEKYFLQFTVFERDEPYFEDGSTLRAEMMISTLG